MGDDSKALVAVESRVGYLSLEWEVGERCHVYVLDLEKLGNRLHAIFECEHGICGYVAKLASQDSLVL